MLGKQYKNIKKLLFLWFSVNFAPEVILTMASGAKLNLLLSKEEISYARQCTLNPHEAFRRVLRQKIPDALLASDYERPVPNPLCMRILQGTEDLEIPEGDEGPIHGNLVIDSDLCKQARFQGEDYTLDAKIIPGIGPVCFHQYLGDDDVPLARLLKINLFVEEIFLDSETPFSTIPGIIYDPISIRPFNEVYEYFLPVFNQEFAEFLQAAREPILKIFKIISENGTEQHKYDLNNIFHIMCLLYTGKDPYAPSLDIDKDSAMPYERKIEIAQEILAGLGFSPYPPIS